MGVRRFLVKMNASAGNAFAAAALPSGRLGLRLRPLLPQTSSAFGIGGAQTDWFIADAAADVDTPTAWDECHRALTTSAFAAAPGAVYMEPDWPQQWLTEERAEAVNAFGVTDTCANEELWMKPDSIPHGARPDWHLEDAFSGLRSARTAVAGAPGRRVRIGHLDTGYDPAHCLLPENIKHDLERSFVEGDNPTSAADPFVSGILKNPGHGTGTLCILAGGKLADLQFPDENTGDYLGGAPFADVIPVRIATSVVLFYTSAFAQGLDYLIAPNGDSSQRCDVISISMGGLASSAWTEVVNRAYDAGVCIFAAAGNNFSGVPTHHIVYPARYDRVTAVCGVLEDGRPYYDLPFKTMQGNWGPDTKMDTAVAAFTPNIPWAKWGCGKAYRWNGEGTSAATPQAAATAAAYAQRNVAALDALPEGWMRVEAIRQALFASAKNTDHQHFGKGVINAKAALDQPFAQPQQKMPADSASFPFLRVLTGWGIADPAAPDMLQLEIVQLTQRSPQYAEIIPDPHVPADQITDAQRKRFFDAVIADSNASQSLKKYAIGAAAGSQTSVPGAPARSSATPIEQPTAPTPAKATLTVAKPDPPSRTLRGYSYDPSLATQLDTARISEIKYEVPWEADLQPGPKGEYLNVVDTDFSSGQTYAPVDLNDPAILAQDGLPPSEGNAQFHQQMVYAVAMRTIDAFEHALGRRALWACRDDLPGGGRFLQRLTIYPHAMQDKNAFYSPERRAVLFGYFQAAKVNPGSVYPGGMVYTCLSHDIVAHELTHALLDGMHSGFRQRTNPDVFAFHEAFADVVAMFQQFLNVEIVEDQLARVRGNLEIHSLLGELAQQFGGAETGHGALRSAVGTDTAEGWARLKPDPTKYELVSEAHARGGLLTAAVFDAFVNIYKNRTADLLRIATGGTGVLPNGALHPDLIRRLASEVRKSAQHVLTMCIRALDYCPPVDITFGDYLRALITADFDLIPDDDLRYRIAFVEAFRRWGIYPLDLTTLSVETLLWNSPSIGDATMFDSLFQFLCEFVAQHTHFDSRRDLFDTIVAGKKDLRTRLDDALAKQGVSEQMAVALGLDPDCEYAIGSLRLVHRISPDGDLLSQVIVVITQTLDPASNGGVPAFGGSTVVADLRSRAIRYCITKNVRSQTRAARQQEYLKAGAPSAQESREPFALLHAGRSTPARPQQQSASAGKS
jgi:Subtilase family